jgi:hypothetical protein
MSQFTPTTIPATGGWWDEDRHQHYRLNAETGQKAGPYPVLTG